MQHAFTPVIFRILEKQFGKLAPEVYRNSELLQYLNIKTKSVSRGSKSRPAFGNHYAIYVLVEDYIKHGYHKSTGYKEDYPGARFSDLLRRQRQLPFGSKLQNHALNHRMNQEFKKYFPTVECIPIPRDVDTNRYWINEDLLRIRAGDATVNIAPAIIAIINAYIEAKRDAFDRFLATCQKMQQLRQDDPNKVKDFIRDLVKPNVDARVFEVVSYAILKEHFAKQSIYWGWTHDEIHEEYLILYKTGRTNANDGGIDFVMRPLGRFFQVTETLDVKKYFLDIDKVQRYPITFVVKTADSPEIVFKAIREQARKQYGVTAIVDRYMDCVEEIINIPLLLQRFSTLIEEGRVSPVIKEIVVQSKVEFNYPFS